MSRDLILQYNVKVGNKTSNINVKKLVSLKHGVTAINQNSTDHFCEDTRQNALAALQI